MSHKAELERREGPSDRRQEERLETVRPAQTAAIDRRADPTKMGGQPGPNRPDMRTTQEIIADQAAAAAKELEEAQAKDAIPALETELTQQKPRYRTAGELLELTRIQEAAAKGPGGWDRDQVDRLRRTAPDPWKHRSDGMQCSTCIWYVAKNGPMGVQEIGRCRRHAPTMSGYPVVFPIDWCGDHKLSEVRV